MRHLKRSCKLGRTSSHRRCMWANMVKSLIEHEKIVTSEAKAKELRRYAERMITLAKKNTLASRRRAIAKLMISFNALTPKEARLAKKESDTSAYNTDRKVIGKLFGELSERYADRQGGYTRIVKLRPRVGDSSRQCLIEYIK